MTVNSFIKTKYTAGGKISATKGCFDVSAPVKAQIILEKKLYLDEHYRKSPVELNRTEYFLLDHLKIY